VSPEFFNLSEASFKTLKMFKPTRADVEAGSIGIFVKTVAMKCPEEIFIPASNRVLRTRLPVQLKARACFCLFPMAENSSHPFYGW